MPSTTRTVDATTLAHSLAEGAHVHLIDVRTPSEYETAHIPGSLNVPLDALAPHLDELAAIPDDVVVVCRSGGRAGQACEQLAQAGLANVSVLDGGMVAWERAGGDVRRGHQRWELERQVRLVAGSIVATSIALSVAVPAARYVAGFVGVGLTVAALTNTCAMGRLLGRLPYNQGPRADTAAAVAALTDPSRRAA